MAGGVVEDMKQAKLPKKFNLIAYCRAKTGRHEAALEAFALSVAQSFFLGMPVEKNIVPQFESVSLLT